MSAAVRRIEKREEKGEDIKRDYPEYLRIAKVIYGAKDLSQCMESVIRLYDGRED